jgi:hypothetical protein
MTSTEEMGMMRLAAASSAEARQKKRRLHGWWGVEGSLQRPNLGLGWGLVGAEEEGVMAGLQGWSGRQRL